MKTSHFRPCIRFTLIVAAVLLLAILPQSHAAEKNRHTAGQVEKERLVLMPIRVPEAEQNLKGAMETALVEGLQEKYEVYSGEQVAQKARQIFLKESETTHKECDETRCMQDIAEAFQAELIATANVSQQAGSYFLALNIQNIFDNKAVYSKSFPCKLCDVTRVIEVLKEMSDTTLTPRLSPEEAAARKAEEIRNKAEQIRQEEQAFQEQLDAASAAEKQRLLEAKAKDDKMLAELKAQAEARQQKFEVQVSSDFPTIVSAIDEIARLRNNIKFIETGYEKELAQTRESVNQRYATQLAEVDNAQRDEFEREADFKVKQTLKHDQLVEQRDTELARLNLATVSAAEVAPLRAKIKELSAREYTVSAESLVLDIGRYDIDAQQFPVHLSSKLLNEVWQVNGYIYLPLPEAKMFKKQWLAGLVRAEAKMKPSGDIRQVELVNDADNSRMSDYGGIFMTDQEREIQVAANAKAKADAIAAEKAKAEREKQAKEAEERRRKEDEQRAAEEAAEKRAAEERRRSSMPTFNF